MFIGRPFECVYSTVANETTVELLMYTYMHIHVQYYIPRTYQNQPGSIKGERLKRLIFTECKHAAHCVRPGVVQSVEEQMPEMEMC